MCQMHGVVKARWAILLCLQLGAPQVMCDDMQLMYVYSRVPIDSLLGILNGITTANRP